MSTVEIMANLLIATASTGAAGGDWQLFIDDYWVHESSNVTPTLHQPEKAAQNPVIRGDSPWAKNPYAFGSLLFDREESVFKLWYMSYNYGLPLAERTPVLYATSKDCVAWDLPRLGLIASRGSKDNNIVLANYGHHDLYSPSVIKDPDDPDPARRYKMAFWDFPLGRKPYQDEGLCVAFSPDGIHWTRHPKNPVRHAEKRARSISDVISVMHDRRLGKYVAYTKGWAEPWPMAIVSSSSTEAGTAPTKRAGVGQLSGWRPCARTVSSLSTPAIRSGRSPRSP